MFRKVLFCQAKWRRKLDDIVVAGDCIAVFADDQPFFFARRNHLVYFGGISRLFSQFVFDEFDSDQQPFSSNIPDCRVFSQSLKLT